ncbi:MAG: FHA domain-containing protein [Methylacidiphilales bacterium]|nr:FHA domain-containing protein [Candidatus Methylacidiphilales bacterium]
MPAILPIHNRSTRRIFYPEDIPTQKMPLQDLAQSAARLCEDLPGLQPSEVPQKAGVDYKLILQSVKQAPHCPVEIPIPSGHWLYIGTRPASELLDGLCLLINHPSVSRLHCALTVHESKLLAFDMGSTNGTFIMTREKKQPLDKSPTSVQKGEYILIGRLFFRVG